MRQILSLALILSLTATQTSCTIFKSKSSSSKQQAQKPSLEGAWELSYIVGGELEELYPTRRPEIVFDLKNNRVSGYNGCNSFSGPISIQDHKLIYPKPLTQTLMACPGAGEQVFMDALGKATQFSFSNNNNTIDLIGGDIGMMQFKRK